MWTCETCGITVRDHTEQAWGAEEALGRTFFGLAAGARLCPRCLEGVQTVGSAVHELQQPTLCSACRGRVERAWAAQLPALPAARGAGEGTFSLPAERTGRTAASFAPRAF